MKFAVGSDERTDLTDWVVRELTARGHQVNLHGALKDGADPQWPNVAQSVAREVAQGLSDEGVLFCWTGTGVSIAANKEPGVRAALCIDAETAKGARLWNEANVLCMSLRLTSQPAASEIIDSWISTLGIDETERDNIESVKRMDQQRAGDAPTPTLPQRERG